ncbi:hypothetical protein [Paenibacillus oleatilyticus]|uniref:DUF4878 domain-containing protein n=1 Tax=Paenibacillus oleatilyticus TaxID=2594886 RepID=A0ABV4V0Q9_9BACL
MMETDYDFRRRKLKVPNGKLSIFIILLLLAAGGYYLYLMITENPDAAKNKDVKTTLVQFYNEFVKSRDVGPAAKYIYRNDGQLIVNYRFYYWDIQSYRIKKIQDIEAYKKKGIVEVRTLNWESKEFKYTDTVTLEYIEGRWQITNYWSTSSDGWPKLP